MIKRALWLLFAVSLLAGAVVAPASAGGKPPKVFRGSFIASARPVPQPWLSPERACARDEMSIDGGSFVDHSVRVPFSGWLQIEMSFNGDWDLALRSEEGKHLMASEYQEWYLEPSEQIRSYVRRGERFVIRACNIASTSDAQVEYELSPGSPWSGPAGKEVTGRLEELSYETPSAAVHESFVICHSGRRIGCAGIKPMFQDRSVAVRVEDLSGLPVKAEVYQYIGSTALVPEFFCGATPDVIPLHPGVDFVGVAIWNGPCSDGTVTAPTRGKIELAFYNRTS